jgi:hypothetical protein
MVAPARKTKYGEKYNESVHETIVAAIRKGNAKTTAARLAGIHPDTLWEWINRGKQNPAEYPYFVQLAEDMAQAKAEIDAEMLEHVLAAPTIDAKHWTAAAWFLERTSPQDFAKRNKVEIDAGDNPLVQLNQVVLLDEGARRQSRELLRAVTGLAAHSADVELAPEEVSEAVD